VFADCGAGLVSTVGDYLASGQILLAGGTYRGQTIVAPELVAAMTTNQLTPQRRDTAGPILDGRGWGFGLSIIVPPETAGRGPKGCGWSGGFGTVWANDPDEDLVAILCTQVLSCTGRPAAESAFWAATYQTLGS
jgi:CubicO group peptidase (beta-lactamase class C family)